MKKKVGLWIDHRKAVILTILDQKEIKTTILSKVEKQPGRFAGVRSTISYESQQVPADDSRERKFTKELNVYYAAVIEVIHDAESILIFGPGEAKNELKKRFERDKLGEHIAGIETADNMTDHQIVEKIREYFII